MGAVDDVALQATLEPDRLALVDLESGRRFSYRDLDRDVSRCAAVLRARGCERGDRVVVIARNDVLLPVVHFACARLGVIFAPLSFRLAPREIEERLADTAPRLFLSDGSREEAPSPDLSVEDLRAAMDDAEGATGLTVDPDLPSLLLFTSGTTGRAKGALLTERNLAESAINFIQLGRVDRESCFLCDAPMFHVIGLVSNVRPAITLGGAMLISNGFDPGTTLSRLFDPTLGVTHYFCVPQMLGALRAHPSYRPGAPAGLTIFTGGAPHAAADVRAALEEGLLVVDGYGMTEVGAVFGMPPQRSIIEGKPGSVGIATRRVQTRIVDEAGRVCDVGEPGELLVRGDNVSPGYFGLDPAEARTDDGWFCTGDICRADAEGFHYVVDRKKDMFISGGENVYPAEIEAQLAGHPGIAEAAVVGVPDPRWGEVGHLAVVPRAGAEIELEPLLALLRERLARYKVPRHVTLVDALPRTPSGKLQKRLLREQLAQGT